MDISLYLFDDETYAPGMFNSWAIFATAEPGDETAKATDIECVPVRAMTFSNGTEFDVLVAV
jgi:hypothetical protein